ncbi:hypothetical protein GS504_15920 [Rhodococcus hoagii]|nr:hypothetical protein [Prescottella equi]
MSAQWAWNATVERDEVEVTWLREYKTGDGTVTASERGALVLEDDGRVAMLGIPSPLPNLEAVQSLTTALTLVAERMETTL